MMFTTASLVLTSIGMSFMLEHGGSVALTVAVLILAAAFMDFLDGRIARATNTCSAFGAQYDSMADLVSFGVTPAWMAYVFCLRALPFQGGLVVAVWYITCVAFRLARFNANVENTHGAFNGLPCPPAAGTLASFVILMETLPGLQLGLSAPSGAAMAPWVAFGMVGLGWLMVSRTPYSSFKSASATKPRPVWVALTILVFSFTIWAFPQLLFGIALLYILTGLVIRFLTRVRWVELVAPRAVLWAERRLGGPPRHSASPKVIR
jgi:CDP-diacylglycerol--serine O-phosphatidyltransferase